MNTNIALRDTRDPFTQALAFLYERGDEAKLDQKFEREMTPLVRQVGIKIGAVATERSINEKALSVFTGIVSLYLAHSTDGRGDLVAWAHQIEQEDLVILFRKGFTLVHAVRNVGMSVERDVTYSIPAMFFEKLERFATWREGGMWAGYALYRNLTSAVKDEGTLKEFSEWIVEITEGHELVRESKEAATWSDEGELTPEVIIRRVLYNVLHIGKPSLHMDYHRAESIVIGAKRGKTWKERAKRHYRAFVRSMPPRFQHAIKSVINIKSEIDIVWGQISYISMKSKDRNEAIDHVCLNVGIPARGMMREAKRDMEKLEE